MKTLRGLITRADKWNKPSTRCEVRQVPCYPPRVSGARCRSPGASTARRNKSLVGHCCESEWWVSGTGAGEQQKVDLV